VKAVAEERVDPWVATIDGDATRIKAAKARNRAVPKKLALLAAAMQATAAGGDYNVSGVFRQRDKLIIVISMLPLNQADEIKEILTGLRLASTLDIRQMYAGDKSSIEVELKPQPAAPPRAS
jgi:hypothetical protein